MNSLEHLKSLPAFVVNLDRSTDRLERFTREVSPMFASTTRIIAVDGETDVSNDEADAWGQQWRDTYEREVDRGELPSILRPMTGKYMDRMRATMAIWKSHLLALQTAYHSGHERFVICEDDISPRSALLAGEVPLPPSADVAIWSGGVPIAAISTDDKDYASGRPLNWNIMPRTKQVHTLLGAGAIEMSRDAAGLIWQEVSAHPMPYDHAFGFAFRQLECVRLYPTGFGQVGESIRNSKFRDQVLLRDAE